jgi:hypothetical protein
MATSGSWMVFRVTALAGASPVLGVRLHVASQMDSVPDQACDFATVPVLRFGADFYGLVPMGQPMPCGPPLTASNVVYFASSTDTLGHTSSSKLYYRFGEMAFGQGFTPRIEHWRDDDLPVPPAPVCGVTRDQASSRRFDGTTRAVLRTGSGFPIGMTAGPAGSPTRGLSRP